MKKTIMQEARQIAERIAADPKRLIQGYKESYPGISDDEAQGLASTFIELLRSGAAEKTKQAEYSKTLTEIERKYSGNRAETSGQGRGKSL